MEQISILVADDDPCIRKCLRHALEVDPRLKIAWQAGNGLEALALAGRHLPDVVLLDAEMPRMDGFEAARCLRQRRPETCIVIMSVYDEVRSRALEAGADAFILKDCGCTEFRSILHSVIEEHACSGGRSQ
jgi:DNA-binding NarL/FixJ family response regulator